MKKLLYILMLFLSMKLNADTVINPFQGLAINIGGGGTIASYDITQHAQVEIPPFLHIVITGTKLLDSNGVGQVSLSYTRAFFQNFTLGVELAANLEHTRVNKFFNVQELMSDFELTGVTTAEQKNNISLVLLPGYTVDINTLVYGLIGARRGNFKVTGNLDYNQNFGPGFDVSGSIPLSTRSGYKTGLTLGTGVRRALSEHFSLSAEYQYTYYGHIDTPGLLTTPVGANGLTLGTAQKNIEKIQTFTNTLLLKLSYLI